MKERDINRSIDPSQKHKGRSKKYKSPTRLFDLNCWPKVLISRDNRICKKTDESSGTTSLSFSESHSSKAQAEEEEEDDDFEEEKDDEDEDEYEEEEEEEEVGKDEEVSCDVQHLCCEEYGTSFEEEQGVCLISSSSEIQEALRTRESTPENVKGSKRLNESGLHCPMMKSVHQDRPIFVDLTADEKNTWKQTILKRFCDVNTLNRVDQGEEPRIMIADSSSKLNCKGSASLATALRDRGQCLIPMQPNRSLPIRPAPPVPTRSFRMDCSSLLFLSKPINLDIVEVEPVTSIDMLSNEEACKSVDVNPNETLAVKEFASSQGYVIPQISSVESLRGVKRKINDDMDYEKDVIKENRKKKRSQEADSSQNRDECAESTIKEFLTNFCGSNETGEAQTTCSDKCVRVVSTTKEGSGGKVVPPLRLKKVVPTGNDDKADRYNNSQATTRAKQESNYRIITGTTPRPESSTVASSWNDVAYEEKTNLASLKTDSYKLKYRRNKLKQKLRELRNKALELAKQMANDSSFQRNTRLRQVMNRYEKQIENLSKLHSKLSTTIPISNEVVDVNDNDGCTIDDEYLLGNLNEESKESLKNSFPAASPEPPKLSPRSPCNYENLLPGEIRDSPPTLPRVCLSISSSQNSVDEDLQNSESKVWPIIEDSTKSTISPGITDSPVRCNPTEEGSADLEECMETRQQNKMNVDEEDFNVTDISLNRSEKPTQFFDSNRIDLEKKKENKKMADETPSDRLMVQELEKIRCREFSASMPVISSVTGGLQVTASVPAKKMFQSPSDKQLALPEEHVVQSTSYEPSRNDVLAAKVNEISQNVQMVTSSSSQSIQLNSIGTMSKQEHFKSQQNCKGEKFPNGSTQMSSNSQSITEQFPTLGNWLARMSKEQTLKTKSELQTVENVSFSSTEKASCIPGPEVPKITGPNTTNNILNTTPQCSTDRWQYYQHQHQRQQRQQRQQQQEQLLQHVAASVTLPQPVPSVPPIRSSICSPISMNQFYPNNYAIDPYNGVALNYHPPLCPYGTYPYPPRLHPSLPGYHLPMQESLRSLQHMDKRFPLVQDPMVKYTSPTTSNLQHPNNMGFDRLRGSSAASNSNAGTCLPPLFLPSSSLPTSQQTLPRSSMSGFSTNNQYSQNRMFPDVVAAAAAAAVVAAASFDRQRDTLTSNRASTDGLQATGLTNVMNGQPPHVASSSKKVVNRDTINQTQDTNFGEEGHDNTAKYQQMQNFLFDRLAFVKTGDNFTQPNSIASGDMQAAMSSIVSTTPYRVASVPSHAQLPKNTSEHQFRNCKTPHLGKVNRSPNNLHSLSCSNCGVIGPKFKCLGCEIIFYCDERCQEKHWNVHMQWCPKKMPKLKKVT